MIHEVRDSNDILHTSNDAIGQAFVNHFSSIFVSTMNDDDGALNDALGAVTCSISNDDILLLIASHTTLDVKLDTMYPDKAPGPDGMTKTFYEKHWHLIGGDFIEAILHVLNDGGYIH